MSRTFRRPRRMVERNEESYVKHNLSCRYRLYRYWGVRRRKPKEQYLAELEKANAEYQEKLKVASYDENGKAYIGFRKEYIWGSKPLTYCEVPRYLYPTHVSRYYYVDKEWSVEEQTQYLVEQYHELSRDGHSSETARNKGFKKAAAKETRRANRRLEKKIIKGGDFDHLPYPDHHEGDHLVWSFW